MAQVGRLVDQFKTANLIAAFPDCGASSDYVIEVRLRVNAPRDRETKQVHGGGMLDALFIAFAEYKRAPASTYSSAASALPGNCVGGICGRKARAPM